MINPIIRLAERLKSKLTIINATPMPSEQERIQMLDDIITLAEDQEDVRIRISTAHASTSLKKVRDEVNEVQNKDAISISVRAMRDEELLAEINHHASSRTHVMRCVTQLKKQNPKYSHIEV